MSERRTLLDSPLLQLTLARLREFYREPGAVFWVFVFPVLLAIGLGIAFRERPPERPRVAAISDGTEWLRGALDSAEGIDVAWMTAEEAREALGRARVDVAVAAVGHDETRTIRYRFDPARPEARLARLALDAALQRSLGRQDIVAVEEVAETEAGSRYIDFLIPGLIGLNLMGSTMWGIGYSVVWARRQRLLKRFAATPMRRTHFLLSYLLSRLLFMILEVAFLVLFGVLIFGVTVHGSIAALAAISLVGSFAFAGISLLIAARPQSVEAASGWMNFVQMPMWLLSGAFFSYERFPEVFHPVIRALPLTAINDALRAVINDGASLLTTWPQLVVLTFWSAASFVLALKIFRWS